MRVTVIGAGVAGLCCALELAERVTVLHYGKLIIDGTRAEVVADARTREVYLGH